jgi:chromosome segregation ATPase
VDTLVDYSFPVAAIFFGAMVVLGVIILLVAGLRLWSRVSAARRRLDAGRVGLETSLERLEAAQAALPRRQEELQGEMAALQADIEQLKVLARYAGEAQEALRSPLRYLGR